MVSRCISCSWTKVDMACSEVKNKVQFLEDCVSCVHGHKLAEVNNKALRHNVTQTQKNVGALRRKVKNKEQFLEDYVRCVHGQRLAEVNNKAPRHNITQSRGWRRESCSAW